MRKTSSVFEQLGLPGTLIFIVYIFLLFNIYSSVFEQLGLPGAVGSMDCTHFSLATI